MSRAWLGWGVLAAMAFPLACGGSSEQDGSAGSGTGGKATGGTSSGGTNAGGAGGTTSGGTGGASSGGAAGAGGSAGAGGAGATGGVSGGGGAAGSAGAGGAGGTGGTSMGGTGGTSMGGMGGGNTGGMGGGNTGGAGGTGSLSCSELSAEYAKTLAAAKKCSSMLPTEQCTVLVDDELACPCKTYVNPANASEVTKLGQLSAQWLKQQCNVGIICPAVLCPMPSGATCQPQGGMAGSCVDGKGGP